jgi:hypothetical protein
MSRNVAFFSVAIFLCAAVLAFAQPATIAGRTAGLERADGFIPFYWDESEGKVLIEIPALDEDILYYVSTAQGIGSVQLRGDRGITGQGVIRFQRIGPRVHVEQQNLRFRAPGGHDELKANVKDSFASSILASLPIEAEENGRILADVTPLVIRDASDVATMLKRANQGAYRLDKDRSSFYPKRTKAFPLNTEIEATLTFVSDSPGPLMRGIAPDPRSLTVRIHHSFLKPPEGYRMRKADPRIAVNEMTYKDYSKPFSEDLESRWVERWRLEKKDPNAAVSEPIKPIIYYLDKAIPEPVRTAMRDGILWWNIAFEEAGFKNAVEVRDPTPDMDPLDIRYAFVLWINRDERGFSSGGTITDPRTGEIIGATTRMDSHRIRTIAHYYQSYRPATEYDDLDYGMFLPPYETLVTRFQGDDPVSEKDMVLARQAVLSAHEIGHTLGFGHNFLSSMDNRASIMEYPTPRVIPTEQQTLDLSAAYETNVGAFDKYMVRYAYTPFRPDEEEEGLEAILQEMRSDGVLYAPSTDPRWNWYDDLPTATQYLRDTMTAREIMLDRYGPEILKPGEHYGELRDMRLWMIYLHHRWAIDAAQKYVGGMFHQHVVKGEEGVTPTEIVPAEMQREILSIFMEAIQPSNLAIPEKLLVNLTTAPYGPPIEDMANDYAFDHLRAARILAAGVIEQLLQPDRAARLIAFADRQESALTFPEVLEAVLDNTWRAVRDVQPKEHSLRRVAQSVALDSMMILGASPDATPEARAVVMDQIARLRDEIAGMNDSDPVTAAHLRQAVRDIDRYMEDPEGVAPKAAGPIWGGAPRSRYPSPPGPPLGGAH